MENIYDVIILGGGPGGLSAGLYAGRSRLKTLLIEKAFDGGQIATTAEIENYPGQLAEDSGPSLVERMSAQTVKFGIEKVYETVTEVQLEGGIKTIKTSESTYQSKTVIIATGANPRPIGCPGEKELVGKGVSYCATCDGAFFEDLEVYVIGGGDTAVEEGVYLTRFARKVTIVHRRDELRAAKYLQEHAKANPKIDFMWNSVVVDIKGDEIIEGMTVQDTKTGERREILPDEEDGTFGIFVFVGFVPNSSLYEGQITMQDGYIVTDEDMRTNIDGVFAVGDIRVKTLRQVVTAAADGAIAATMADKYILGH
ncbi:MAG: thioredoxin-disulfide reductase [Clostridiales bacterium]|jgi:thioredoxin reductase (NADPH)|nr:thioredoxin-disulfide reductase [Clostridiales bacterium]